MQNQKLDIAARSAAMSNFFTGKGVGLIASKERDKAIHALSLLEKSKK